MIYSQEKNQVIYMLPKVFMASENLEDDETHCLWGKKNTIFKKPSGEGYLTLEELYELDKLQLDKVYNQFLIEADKKKEINDDDLPKIIKASNI